MQITPIIPTTDTLIGEALSLAKVALNWLGKRLVGTLCVKIYTYHLSIPYKVLGTKTYYGDREVAEANFVWFPGVGLGFVKHAKDIRVLIVPKTGSYDDGRKTLDFGFPTTLADGYEITLPRWSYAAFMQQSRHIIRTHAPDPVRATVDSVECSTNIKPVLASVVTWGKSERWFAKRGIPHTLGLLFYGPPGSGKSTLAQNVASLLGRTIKKVDLSSVENLYKSVDYDPKSNFNYAYASVWLIEDIDAVFHKRVNVSQGTLAFDDLLNLLSGADLVRGRVIIITTNHPETLDPALAHIPTDGSPPVPRPGRIDHIVYVGPLDKEARERVVARVFPDRPELWHDLVMAGEGETIALFQARCVTLALELKAKENT
jgi:hypothetical protein